MAKIFSLINQKGGVGKTSSTINIGAELSLLGYKVLLIDADPQCDLTSSLGVFEQERYNVKDFFSMLPLDDIEQLKVSDNLYLLSGYFDLMEFKLTKKTLELPLLNIAKKFDYIIFDCQPQRVVQSKLTINECVLNYTDSLLIPLDVNYNSVKGTIDFINSIERIQVTYNTNLKIGGIFFTNVNNQELLFSEFREYLETLNKELLFNTYIRRDVNVKKSQSIGEPLCSYAPNSNATKDYKNLVDEINTKL